MNSEDLNYCDESVALSGICFRPDGVTTGKPAFLVVPDGFGLGAHAIGRAHRFATETGCTVLAADMYGGRRVGTNVEEATVLLGDLFSNRMKLRGRISAAYDALCSQPGVDSSSIGAFGYCLGGAAVLELARSGANVQGVVSFHGSLDQGTATSRKIGGRVLVCHGSEDPLVPLAQVNAFQEEMRQKGADWQLNVYGGAFHSFTNEAAADMGVPGLAYHAGADSRSWQAMRAFFAEIFFTP